MLFTMCWSQNPNRHAPEQQGGYSGSRWLTTPPSPLSQSRLGVGVGEANLGTEPEETRRRKLSPRRKPRRRPTPGFNGTGVRVHRVSFLRDGFLRGVGRTPQEDTPQKAKWAGRAVHTGMDGFKTWMLMLESGRFDRGGFNDLFRRQLAELLTRVTDADRRASLERMQDFDWVGYILAALRNAGLADQGEQEEAAHDVVVYLLVRPGQLLAGYDAATNGPMEGRFRVAVQNAVRNVIRTRRRRERDRATGGSPDAEIVAGVVPSRLHRDDDGEVLEAFRAFLRREVGEDAVRLLDRRLDGVSLRQLAGDQGVGVNAWAVRRLVRRVREAALAFARRQHDDEFVRAVERLLTPAQRVEEARAGWSSPWQGSPAC